VGPRLGRHLALDALLDAVVADRRRGVERLPDVVLGELAEEPGALGVARPHAREAVGHELDADRAALGPDILRSVPEHAEQVLDVMAVLVGDHVALGKRPALRAEPLLQLVVEAQIEVYVRVEGAIEGPHGRRRRPAPRIDRAVVEHGLGGLIRLTGLGEGVVPVVLDAVDEADDPAVLALVGVLARLARGQLGPARPGDETPDPSRHPGCLGRHPAARRRAAG
jgi:hypothetical protein